MALGYKRLFWSRAAAERHLSVVLRWKCQEKDSLSMSSPCLGTSGASSDCKTLHAAVCPLLERANTRRPHETCRKNLRWKEEQLEKFAFHTDDVTGRC